LPLLWGKFGIQAKTGHDSPGHFAERWAMLEVAACGMR